MFPFNATEFPLPHGLKWQSVTLSNKKVIPFQPEWSETNPGIQLSPSSFNLTNPDDLTVTYPFIEGLAVDNKNQPQPIMLLGKVEVIAPRKVITYDLNLFAQTLAYAIGSMPLFLASIEKNTIAAGHLPEGLEFKGNALIVDQKTFSSQDWRFYAKDDSGNYLKEILAVSHSATADGPALLDVHYFYGQPTHLETYRRTELNTVEYGFEVKLDRAQTENPVE